MQNNHQSPLAARPLNTHESPFTRLNPFIDVTQPPFNARGDGQTDDAPAFQRAVDSQGEGTLRLPRGKSASAGTLRKQIKPPTDFRND